MFLKAHTMNSYVSSVSDQYCKKDKLFCVIKLLVTLSLK